MKLLFVCSGNICRSPMAAEYFRHRAAQCGLSHVVVGSAGLLGIDGAPASPEAVEVMREIGVDLRHHRSAGLQSEELRTTDMVLVMSRHHMEEMARRFPAGNEERWMLRAFEQGPDPRVDVPDLEDPIGRPIDVYQRQREIITASVDHLILHLRYRR